MSSSDGGNGERLCVVMVPPSRGCRRAWRATRTGTSAQRWLLQQRTTLTQGLLETTDLPVELVARTSGFGSAVTLRSHFQRTVGASPRDYRAVFSRSRPCDLEQAAV